MPNVKNYPTKGKKGFTPNDTPLTEEERHQVARWLGEFYPPGKIPDLVKTTFGKTVDQTFAYPILHSRKWGLLIDRYRQEWMVGELKVPLAHRRYRLERLMTLIERLDARSEKGLVPPDRYQTQLVILLEKARLEMEERPESHTYFFTNINSFSDAELLQRREELLKRIQQFRLPIRRETNGVRDRLEGPQATVCEAQTRDGGSPHLGDDQDHGAVGERGLAR